MAGEWQGHWCYHGPAMPQTPIDLDHFSRRLASRQRKPIPIDVRPRAAVLIALYGPGPDYRVLYTVRTHHVEHHKGEISFPGGGRDPEDGSEVHTALREGHEEIGVVPSDVQVVGLLDDMVTRTNFVVTPIVGRLARHPYPFVHAPLEVAEILEVPLSHLQDAANYTTHPQLPPDRQPSFPSYRFGEHIIFGATARMTGHFLALLQ
ncbi:MAG: CoA pyrophosphatase, partial [Chloroflexi bacterium]|nr:CoA pyrophosphatase [Chloroflexota bacterium]